MNLYLIRHGEAEQTSEGKQHEERSLTANGIETLKISIETWKNYHTTFDIILTSPLKRAKQTALIIHNSFKTQFDVAEEISLLNGGLAEDLLSVARDLDLNDIAMIGHQPDLSNHIASMIGSTSGNIKLQPSSIAKISFNDKPSLGKGILEFLLPPINKKG